MKHVLQVGQLNILVSQKNIKNVHLAVYPPEGEVRVSAPLWAGEDQIRDWVLSKLGWIKKQQARFLAQVQPPDQKILNQATTYVWGKPHVLRLYPNSSANYVEVSHGTLNLYVRGVPKEDMLNAKLRAWHKTQVSQEGQKRILHWREIFGLPEISLTVRTMKTRWGTCAPWKNKITLNSQLATRPYACLDYVVVHELAHFFVPNHGEGFKSFMDKWLPDWQTTRKLLNCRSS